MKQYRTHAEYLIDKLKNPDSAALYLEVAFEEYEQDDDFEGLLLAIRRVAEARIELDKEAGVKASKAKRLLAAVTAKPLPSLDQLRPLLHVLGFRFSVARIAV